MMDLSLLYGVKGEVCAKAQQREMSNLPEILSLQLNNVTKDVVKINIEPN